MVDKLIGEPRCGKKLRVSAQTSFSMLKPGDYACTLPEEHIPKDEHACVVRWIERKP